MSFSEGRYDVKKEPALRFPGFKGEWKRCKIDDIVVEYNERTTTNNQFEILSSTHEGIKFQKDHFNKVTASADTTGYKIVPKGFFTYRSMSDNGIFVFNQQNIINKGIVSPAYPVFDVIKADKMFFKQYINNTSTIKRELIRIKEGGTRYALSFSKLRSIVLQFPSLQEQQKIGSFLATIDALISETEKELEACREQKRGMLQKMFPKNGADVPEIRFPGFTDAWEQRKLGDLGSLKNGMNFSKDAMGHGYAFVNLQNIFGNNVVDVKSLGLAEASEKQLLEYSLQKGDVLFVRSSVKLEGVGEAALVAETLENTTYSGFIIRFRDEYGLNNDFKKFVFVTKKVRDQIMSQATNSANKNISQSVLENLTFEIPSKDEQKQIGEYFSSLDNLITLHQRELDRLLELKKGFMQKMFC